MGPCHPLPWSDPRIDLAPTSSVYDVSSRPSFTALTSWFREISTYCSPEVVKIIVGNKVDKEMFGRQVGKEEGAEFARKMGCLFVGA